ncbi:MAG: flagellar assembly protein FliH [Deltaproteobacteria bacterium]|nr:flagellar assembly protein FliH [Deltaproteobacteria bacterium]
MKVLRGAGSLRVLPGATMAAHDEVRAMLQRAAQEAEETRARARAEALAHREAALAEALGQARVEAVALLVDARARASRTLAEAEAELATLALEIARAVLGREAASGPEVLRDVARRALSRVRQARRVVLRVHPEDLPWAEADARRWLPAGMVPEVLAFEADPGVARGGCLVDTELGRVDARIDAQLAALARGTSRA